MKYNVYSYRLNGDTHNFDGLEWIIDGEAGRRNYPGTYPIEHCVRLYKDGISWEHVLKEHRKKVAELNKRFK